MDLAAEWLDRLRPEAGGYARLALENITREFPALVSALMTAPGQFPSRPRDRTPVFYGSFDWHSCVEMHWVLVRLLRMAPDVVPGEEIRSALNAQLTPEGLGREAEYARQSGTGLRHYGWGWALTLMHELATWPGDNDARRWAAAMEPLAAALTANFLGWLPKATYPIRVGVHANSSFALSRALPYARLQAETGRPELAEAELMARLLPPDHFPPWLDSFLPGLAAGEPAALFTPAVVSDSSDGQIAHLHGLNLSRAWCWRRLAETLPAGDPRVPVCAAAARTHAEASLPHVVADDYMVTHWLAAYAVLLFS